MSFRIIPVRDAAHAVGHILWGSSRQDDLVAAQHTESENIYTIEKRVIQACPDFGTCGSTLLLRHALCGMDQEDVPFHWQSPLVRRCLSLVCDLWGLSGQQGSC
eukprot:120486-Amphidinium_carterae.1